MSVYAKTAIRIVHTHAHTNARRRAGVQTHRWGGLLFHSALAVSLRPPHSKKFELFLNFSSKFESNCENLLYIKKKLGRRLLLLLFILFFLVLLLLLEERGRPQPFLLLLGAER